MNESKQQPVRILPFTVDDSALKRLSDRQRNQLFGCMHAHNELTFLNRLLLFSMTDVADGALHDSAKSVQMWCVLQLLTGKLFETWVMVIDRVLSATPEDSLIGVLPSDYQASLAWLRNYFGDKQTKPSALKTVRDKTAFHYAGLNLAQPLKNLAADENRVYLAQHPANALYYLGSAVVFRSIFAEIATAFAPPSRLRPTKSESSREPTWSWRTSMPQTCICIRSCTGSSSTCWNRRSETGWRIRKRLSTWKEYRGRTKLPFRHGYRSASRKVQRMPVCESVCDSGAKTGQNPHTKAIRISLVSIAWALLWLLGDWGSRVQIPPLRPFSLIVLFIQPR